MKENGIVSKKEVPSKALFRAMASSLGEKSSGASRVAIVLIHPRKKKSEISADFSAIFRFSVGVEKKIHGKNRLKKFRRKIADFSPKNKKNPTFSRKNPIFPEIWDKFYFRSLRGKKLKNGAKQS